MSKAKLETLTILDEFDHDVPIIKLTIPKSTVKAPANRHAHAMNTDQARALGRALIKLAAELDTAEY